MSLFVQGTFTKVCSDAICCAGMLRRSAPPLLVCPGRTNQVRLVGPRRRQDALQLPRWSRSSPPKQ